MLPTLIKYLIDKVTKNSDDCIMFLVSLDGYAPYLYHLASANKSNFGCFMRRPRKDKQMAETLLFFFTCEQQFCSDLSSFASSLRCSYP